MWKPDWPMAFLTVTLYITIIFLESLLLCKISGWLTPLFLRYKYLKKSVIWLVECIFDPAQLNIFKSFFIFIQSVPDCKKPCRGKSWKSLVKSISNYVRLKIYQLSFVSWIYICIPKIKLTHQFFLLDM